MLFVGYGWHDAFDIQPALLAARDAGAIFYWADQATTFPKHPTLAALMERCIEIDLTFGDRNPLWLLAQRQSPSTHPFAAGWNWSRLEDRAKTGCVLADNACPISELQQLRTIAALYYALELGDRAVTYFEAAHDRLVATPPHTSAPADGAPTTPIAALIACARTTTTIQTGSPSGRIDTGLTTWPTSATASHLSGNEPGGGTGAAAPTEAAEASGRSDCHDGNTQRLSPRLLSGRLADHVWLRPSQ
jgi:hypothetical protein